MVVDDDDPLSTPGRPRSAARPRCPRRARDSIAADPPTAVIRPTIESRTPRRSVGTVARSKPGPSSRTNTSAPSGEACANTKIGAPAACRAALRSASRAAAASASVSRSSTAVAEDRQLDHRVMIVLDLGHRRAQRGAERLRAELDLARHPGPQLVLLAAREPLRPRPGRAPGAGRARASAGRSRAGARRRGGARPHARRSTARGPSGPTPRSAAAWRRAPTRRRPARAAGAGRPSRPPLPWRRRRPSPRIAARPTRATPPSARHGAGSGRVRACRSARCHGVRPRCASPSRVRRSSAIRTSPPSAASAMIASGTSATTSSGSAQKTRPSAK